MRQEVLDLIAQAEEDLKTAVSLIEKERWYASVFFSQQSSEKN